MDTMIDTVSKMLKHAEGLLVLNTFSPPVEESWMAGVICYFSGHNMQPSANKYYKTQCHRCGKYMGRATTSGSSGYRTKSAPLNRKEKSGKIIKWAMKKTELRIPMLPTSYLERETLAASKFLEYKKGGGTMSKKNNDSKKACRDNFLSHLEKSSDKVRSWPEWKQESLQIIKFRRAQHVGK